MIKVNVRGDISRALSRLDNIQRKQVPYATALALTKTGQAVKAALETEIGKVFDKPTAFTRNSLFLSPATKARLTAHVWIKDRQVKYLLPEVFGGGRNTKGFEKLLQRTGMMPAGWYAVPAKGVKLDGYGNVAGSTITKILSQLESSRDPTANENAKAKKKRNRSSPRGRYFAVQPGRSHLLPGIWERMGSAWGSAVRLVFLFTPKKPGYQARLKFYEIGERVAREEFPIQFRLAMRRALATAR